VEASIAVVVRLKYRPGRQSLTGEPSVTSSYSGLSTFATSAIDLCNTVVSTDIQLFSINNLEVRNCFLKYNQTGPPHESTKGKSVSA
jgi:hypothetical protein